MGWRVDVTDHGPGIDPAFRTRLFGKFAQADGSDRRAQGGTGLGLYISRRLIERMGGSISVQSQTGEGSTFSLVLPAHREGQSAGADTAESAGGPWTGQHNRS
jgi:signal transduction histidine kinase